MAVTVYFKNGQLATHTGAKKVELQGGRDYREVLILRGDAEEEVGRFMVDELVGWTVDSPPASGRLVGG